MSTSSYQPSFTTEKGGGGTAIAVLSVAVIILIVVIVIGMVCGCKSASTPAPAATPSVVGAQKQVRTHLVPRKKPRHNNPVRANMSTTTTARARGTAAARIAASVPTTTGSSVPSLMAASEMPAMVTADAFHATSSTDVGTSEGNHVSTDAGGVSASDFNSQHYAMNPGVMSAASATDVSSMGKFMPNMAGGKPGGKGPVDPATGLPLFTPAKLVRSQMLGGFGKGSFLRQQQDPLSGYSRLGKNMSGSAHARKDLDVRRKQYTEARAANSGADPVLFQTSEFADF